MTDHLPVLTQGERLFLRNLLRNAAEEARKSLREGSHGDPGVGRILLVDGQDAVAVDRMSTALREKLRPILEERRG